MALVLLSVPANAQRPRTQPIPGDLWCYFPGHQGNGWCNNGWTLAQTRPNLNAEPGDVWTYFGPTLGAGWGPSPSIGPQPPSFISDPVPVVF